jgi:hypothetical protein
MYTSVSDGQYLKNNIEENEDDIKYSYNLKLYMKYI